LRAAVQAVNFLSGASTINLPAGNYVLTVSGAGEDSAATGDLDITSGPVSVLGSGATRTIIDGNQSDRVFHLTRGGSNLILDGITIQNGNVGSPENERGGGILVDSGDIAVSNVIFTNNTGRSGGGVSLFGPGNADFRRTVFDSNSSTEFFGGGIESIAGRLAVADSDFTSNHARIDGGGVYVYAGNIGANIARSRFGRNNAQTGGGIAADGLLSVTDTVFTDNSALDGGGLASVNGTVSVTASTLTGNNASVGGGVFSGGRLATTNVVNTTISANSADDRGGGIFINDGNASIVNSTITANRAPSGGNFYRGSDLAFGILLPQLKNSIIANAQSGGDCGSFFSPVLISQGNNIESGSTCGFTTSGDLQNTDPRLGPLQNNGGPTQTHALLSDSPAVDVGENTRCPAADQRGIMRPIDGNGDGIAVCDIGAYEYQPPPFAATRTATATATNTSTATPAPTRTATATRTSTPTSTATATVMRTSTPIAPASHTNVPTATPTPTSLTVAQALAQVAPSGQQGAACADQPGQACQARGGVNGSGAVVGSMRWTLTATVPPGVAPGTVSVAVFSTTAGLQGFPCAAVVAGVVTVVCNGITAANALQGSVVTVVFAPGVVAVGTVTGPGAGAGLAGLGVAGVLPLLPPPPPILLPPPPSPLIAIPPGAPRPAAGPAEVPIIPEADTAALLLAGLLVTIGARCWRRM
jgi:hypothetical protein